MKIDFQREMEAEIESLGGERPRLMMHVCCAPCSSAVIERVAPYFQTALFYYNPNIHPAGEYEKRFQEFPKLLRASGFEDKVELIKGQYREDEYFEAVKGYEDQPEGGERCHICFRLRLEETAKLAAERGYQYFCTTLTVSPHKDAMTINALGRQLAEKWGVKWLPSDFKKRDGYLRSIRLSQEYGLYRQCYCGCAFALR